MFRKTINASGQIRCFSSKRMMGKHLITAGHPRKVRRDRVAKAAKVHRRLKRNQELKSRHVLEVEEAVKALQPSTGFLAPLNPSPRLNPEFSSKPRMSALNFREVPISLREPLDGVPQSWVHSFDTLDKVNITNLSVDIFSQPLRVDIVHRVVHWQRAQKRQGTHKEKGRWEVSGGGKKPWAQKGSGRARHGSIRSPIWRGGGVVHPRTPANYDYPLPKSIREKGLKVVLSQKLRENNLLIMKSIPENYHEHPDELKKLLRSNGIKSATIVDKNIVKGFQQAMMGVDNLFYMPVRKVGVFALLSTKHTIITEDGLRALQNDYCLKEDIAKYNKKVKRNRKLQDLIPDAVFDKEARTPVVRQRHKTLSDTDWGRRRLKRIEAQAEKNAAS